MDTLIAYRTAPNAEHKAAAELRQAGIKAYVPRDRSGRRSPFTGKKPATAPGYVIAAKPHSPAPFDKHVRGRIGRVSQVEIGRLYIQADRVQQPMRAFTAGDKVRIQRGAFATLTGTVVEPCKKGWLVDVALFGKPSRVSLSPQSMRKIHVNPG